MTPILLDNVIRLLNLGIGDIGRLEHIKSTLEENKTLYSSDKNYVEKMIESYIVNQEIKTDQVKDSSSDESTKAVYCSKCGNRIIENSNFCNNCGTVIITNQESSKEKNGFVSKSHKRSPFWYLLPIFLNLIGGVIAYFILKDSDHQKAKRALILGILLLLIPLSIWISLQIVYGTENPFYVVSSGSMVPVLQVYDIVIVQGHVSFEDIQVGDIIVFNRPSGHDRVIVHRVASIIDDEPKTIRTKGDANPAPIPGTDFPITKEEYIGKVAYVIPQVGYVTQLLKPPMNYVLYVVFLGIIFGILGNKHQKYKKSSKEEFDKKENKSNEMPKVKVSVAWQIVLWFIPIASIWAVYRIKKLQRMIAYNAIIFAGTFTPLIIIIIVAPDSSDQIYDMAIYGYMIGYFVGMFIPLYFLIKWSRQWNKRIEANGIISHNPDDKSQG